MIIMIIIAIKIMIINVMLSMRGMRGSRGSYTPRGGGVATSQQAASGLVISNVSEHDKHEMINMRMMIIMKMK